jgi:agmatine deiminase
MSSPLPAVRQPAEWEPQAAIWTAWPSHPGYWDGWIDAARAETAALVRALSTPQAGCGAGVVHVWVDPAGDGALASATAALAGLDIKVHQQPFGDIWLRDTGPLFVRGTDGQMRWRAFANNGWGGKYLMEGDRTVGERIGRLSGLEGSAVDWVLEGGGVESDGHGLMLSTCSCLLHPNRNGVVDTEQVERVLREHLGMKEMIWLGDGLANDHTDGHIDNLARFVGPAAVVCQRPFGEDDPNADVLRRAEADLRGWRSADGRALTVHTVASPGRVADASGAPLPASHMNFVVANHCVVVPVYGTASSQQAVAAIGALFPDRPAIGLPAGGILRGGGAFHCMTQHQPE